MYSLDGMTWIRLVVWLAIGLAIYFGYSIKHSHLRAPKR
jgi:APA family basic amino acid/polyamine antiporter